MKMIHSSAVICLIILGFCSCESKLPDFIKPCKYDVTVGECFKERGNEAIPHLIHGYSAFKIPNLVPFKLDKVVLKENDKVKFYLNNVEIAGMENWKIVDAVINPNKSVITFANPLITSNAEYDLDGTIKDLPIHGKGGANSTIGGVTFKYIAKFNMVQKDDGKPYVQIIDPKFEYGYETYGFYLDNLYDGDKEKAANGFEYLQKNLKEVLVSLDYPVLKQAGEIISSAFTALELVPFNEVFIIQAP